MYVYDYLWKGLARNLNNHRRPSKIKSASQKLVYKRINTVMP